MPNAAAAAAVAAELAISAIFKDKLISSIDKIENFVINFRAALGCGFRKIWKSQGRGSDIPSTAGTWKHEN